MCGMIEGEVYAMQMEREEEPWWAIPLQAFVYLVAPFLCALIWAILSK